MTDDTKAGNDGGKEKLEQECGQPCDPQLGNECCAEYWARMEREGFWNGSRWTEKGWREITK